MNLFSLKFRFLIVCVLAFLFSTFESSSAGFPSRRSILQANPDLQKVLDHCVNDSLKYEAALYLIDNLPYHYSSVGDALEPCRLQLDLFSQWKMSRREIVDSVRTKYGKWNISTLKNISDVYIDPNILIDNIDWAFKVWREQPWGKNISFEDFCEYVLPYRVGNEELKPWRRDIYNRFKYIIDSLKDCEGIDDPGFVASAVLDSVAKLPYHFTDFFSADVHVGPDIAYWRSGSCLDLTDAMVYIFRALGIPCTIDMMLMRGDGNAPHYWNVTFDSSGNQKYFSLLYRRHRLQSVAYYPDIKGKVYRQMFALNKEMVDSMAILPDSVHPQFRYPCFYDVSYMYLGDKALQFFLGDTAFYHKISPGGVVYVCQSRGLQWVPTAWTVYDGSSAEVNNIEGNVVYRLATFNNQKLRFLTDPFLLESGNGNIRFFRAENEFVNVELFYKFSLKIESYLPRMVGGVFEGSCTPDFSEVDTLAVIDSIPTRLCTKLRVDSDKKYRYLRYFGPRKGYCNISEITFLGPDGVKYSGTVIGKPGVKNKKYTYVNAFDGDPYTSFDYPEPSGGWVGLDLGEPKSVEAVVFSPRNHDNFIRKGDEYVLFYESGGNWNFAGMKKASSDSLTFKVPKGALLFLSDRTRGVQERIFEYRDGKQLFW